MYQRSPHRNMVHAIRPGYGFTGMCHRDEIRSPAVRIPGKSSEYIEYKIFTPHRIVFAWRPKCKKAPIRDAALSGALRIGASCLLR